jgi:hypothetical protein
MKKVLLACCLIAGFGLLLAWSQAAEVIGEKKAAKEKKGDIKEIIKLQEASVGEALILEYIKTNNLKFELSADDIVALKKIGLGEDLIRYMISGEKAEKSDGKATLAAQGGATFPFEIETDLTVLSPHTYKHLSVYPVIKKKPAGATGYISLDEAVKGKNIVIKELDNESVPTVNIKNNSNSAVYIMAGEVILGGKQDRTISYDVVIPPHKDIKVSVKCVEHGRWSGDSKEFKASKKMVSSKSRAKAQLEDQSEVWNAAAESSRANNAASSTGSFRAVLESKDVDKNSEPFIKSLEPAFKIQDQVGVIVSLNGKVQCTDIFFLPELFSKVQDKLLKAYVLDALENKEENTAFASPEDIKKFFEDIKQGKTENLKVYNHFENSKKETKELYGTENKDAEGRLLHRNYYLRPTPSPDEDRRRNQEPEQRQQPQAPSVTPGNRR